MELEQIAGFLRGSRPLVVYAFRRQMIICPVAEAAKSTLANQVIVECNDCVFPVLSFGLQIKGSCDEPDKVVVLVDVM